MLVKLGETLAKAREEKRASLETIARDALISGAYLHKLESGVVNSPSPRVLARVALALDVPYLSLMELAGYLDETELAEVQRRTPSSAPHPLANRELTSDEWKAVGAFIKDLVAQRKQDDGS